MKQASRQWGYLRHPLDHILGAKGHVAIIRELIHAGEPVSHSELIERSGLSRQGVYDVVDRLAQNGLVTYAGSGSRQLVTLRKNHPLYEALAGLFHRERHQFENLFDTLREIIRQNAPQPESAWVFGKTAPGLDEYGDPLQIALLGKPQAIDAIVRQFRDELNRRKIEATYDVTIDTRGVTRADLDSRPSLIEKGTIHLWGTDPFVLSGNQPSHGSRVTSHRDFDEKSRPEATIWALLIRQYPDLVPRTLEWLNRRLEQPGNGESLEWQEWKHILESSSYQRLRKFLESDTERAVRLRQSLPFRMVLTDHELEQFEKLKRNHTSS
jgi:hypothetical protein